MERSERKIKEESKEQEREDGESEMVRGKKSMDGTSLDWTRLLACPRNHPKGHATFQPRCGWWAESRRSPDLRRGAVAVHSSRYAHPSWSRGPHVRLSISSSLHLSHLFDYLLASRNHLFDHLSYLRIRVLSRPP